jgi:uncharacterized membrane protein YdjX (TVP38/TMEM64 family)
MKTLFYTTLFIAIIVIAVFLCFPGFEQRSQTWLDNYKNQHGLFAAVSFCILLSDILLPVPSSIVMFVNGAVLGILQGALLSFVASVSGSMLGYAIGRFPGKAINRLLPEKNRLQADEAFRKHGPLTIIVTRGIPVLAEAVAITAGLRRMKAVDCLWLNMAGYAPVCLLYAVCGHYSSNKYSFLLAVGASVLVAFLYWMVGRRMLVKTSHGA